MSSSSSSSPSSFFSVVHQDRDNVPVLYELLKSDEEQCRVWLRAEMNQIPDPLIDSLFAGLIMSSSSSSSSSAVSQHRPTVPELCQQLEGEKLEVRRVLRGEMDRLVNTLFEILSNKLMTNSDLDRSEDAADRAQVDNLLDQFESHQPSFPIPIQPSTSFFSPNSHQQHSDGDELNTVEMIEIKEEMEDGEKTRVIDCQFDIARLNEHNQVKREIQEENEMELKYVMDKATQTNEQIKDWVKREIKEEEKDGQMIEIKEEVEEEDGDDETRFNNIEGMTGDSEDGDRESQSRDNVKIETTQQMDESEIKDEFDYGHETEIKQEDEDQTTNNEVKMEIKEEEEEDGETQDNDMEGLAEENQGGDDESRSAENAPTDTTPPHPTGQSKLIIKQSRVVKRKQTDNEQANEENNRDIEEDEIGEGTSQSVKRPRPSRPIPSNDSQEKQVITVTLRCDQVGCEQMIDKDQFDDHMWNRHWICPYRCPVKDCGESFNNTYLLSQHRKQSHPDTSQWQCGKCAKHFSSYKPLSCHNFQYHQLGLFQCSFPACTFTGEIQVKVYKHFTQQHKQILKCGHAGCPFETPRAFNLKQHERVHSGAKPYRCKWPHCVYASTRKFDTICHIRRSHFAAKPSSASNEAQLGDPKDYVEVVNDLLL